MKKSPPCNVGEKSRCCFSQRPSHTPMGPPVDVWGLPPQASVWKLEIERWRNSTESILLRVHLVSRNSSNSGVYGDSIKPVVWPDFILMAWPQNSMTLQFLVPWPLTLALPYSLLKKYIWGFPGDSVVKNPPAHAGGTGFIPGRSHMMRDN